MKRIFLLGGLGILVIIVIALVSAVNMGEKSPIYAQGTIELSPELVSEAAGIRTLYIILHNAESQMPMPYAGVKERLSSDFTQAFDFALTKEMMMMMNPDAPAPQYLRIKARLDKDGVAGADQSGDLVGMVENVKTGSAGITIRISKKIP